ncbi:hypothetical protein BGS_1181 [Beggiatoa sp. SS]|nr:hypothetical protein BGS_1181 [Beggiatoa sp. SS]
MADFSEVFSNALMFIKGEPMIKPECIKNVIKSRGNHGFFLLLKRIAGQALKSSVIFFGSVVFIVDFVILLNPRACLRNFFFTRLCIFIFF